jgi:pimeloyl-ACP methyl ester carboxylesterase
MSATYRVPGAILTEREHSVPLDHADRDGDRITVFTREVTAPDGPDRPYLVFLQGGPGFEATRPTSPPTGWMKRALQDYRVLLLDQRGTGRSTPVGSEIPGESPEAQARFLTLFRADSIVRDAEHVRKELGVEQWSVLGQSFGGFTSMAYLSIAPEGLREAFITGGLSPIGRPIDDIYGATYRQLVKANERYYARYPGDRPRVGEILRRLTDEAVMLPTGDRLTARRFRQLGNWLGDSAGFELLHHVVELPFGSLAFLHDAEAGARFSRNPIYATLHESSYADGVATRWSAERLLSSAELDDDSSRPSTSFGGCGRTTVPFDPSGRPPRSSPSTNGRPSITPNGCATTRSRSPRRSTSTTCTWTGTWPRRRPGPSERSGSGRPTSSSTTDSEPMVSGSSAG